MGEIFEHQDEITILRIELRGVDFRGARGRVLRQLGVEAKLSSVHIEGFSDDAVFSRGGGELCDDTGRPR